MKSKLNRELIDDLNQSNEEFLDNISSKVTALVDNALADISLKSPFVRTDRCLLLPVNEICTGAVAQLTEFDYFVAVDNPQIELNSKKKGNFWKNVWREFRASFRLGKKKYKKEKVGASTEPVTKYNIEDFKHDLVNSLANYLLPTSIVYEYTTHLSMVGIDDFGTNVRINLIPCCLNAKQQEFKLYNPRKNKYTSIKFGDRFSNLSMKTRECGDVFIDMIRLFNVMYSKNYNKIPNQILVESLVFNCPNILFDKNDVYKTFVNVANYIRLTSASSMLSICDGSKTIFQEPLVLLEYSQVEYGKIISMLDKFTF